MDKERVGTQTDVVRIERDYSRFFAGNDGRQRPTEIERQGFFTQYSAYSHQTVTYASNTRR